MGRLEDVEADMAMSLSQMRAAEKTAQAGFERDAQDMKLEKTQKEKDIEYKTAEAQRLDGELNDLNADQESMQTEMSAILDFTKGLEAECLVTPESFAEKHLGPSFV
ncbi:BPM3 [Symbiodinium natans]|uniref:BPM3 protein n=1 Tax=Symbiodinium natans TaxID=878477 RepID=A0A812PAV2_9DINO|nr:BPM3 [Symbiodinium natans]